MTYDDTTQPPVKHPHSYESTVMPKTAPNNSSQGGEEKPIQMYDMEDEREQRRRPTLQVSDVEIPPSNRDERSQASISAVSPELLAEITERIKREVVEHLTKQPSNTEYAAAEIKPAELRKLAEVSKTVEPPKPEPMQRESSKSTTTPSPPPTAPGVYTPPSPDKIPPPVSESPPASSAKERPGARPFNIRQPADQSSRTVRPSNEERTYSNAELSVIDQKWGRLFDNDRHPTPRLGQFLRGLANHIIEEFAPKKSIVVTPEKLVAFYALHPLEKEAHPMISIFKSQSNEQISQLFQDLGCQHHLVQDDPTRPPKVPGLTPLGFSQWLTISILAYPEQEACRLEKVVLAMPIDSDGEMVDGKPERLPKQISRHLLPSCEDKNYRQLLDETLSDFWDDLEFSRRRKGSGSSPPISRRASTTQPKRSSKPTDPERMGQSSPPSESSTVDDNFPIERQRKPYTAQPGSGKIHDSNLNIPQTVRGRADSTGRSTREQDFTDRHTRTQSNASSMSNPTYIPVARPVGIRRPSSPVLQKFSNSMPSNIDATNVSYIPPSFSTAAQNYTPFPTTSDPRDQDREEDFRRYSRDTKRNTMDDPRGSDLNNVRDSRRNIIEDPRIGEGNRARDAERWDRIQEARGSSDQRSQRDYDDYPRGSGRSYESGQYHSRY